MLKSNLQTGFLRLQLIQVLSSDSNLSELFECLRGLLLFAHFRAQLMSVLPGIPNIVKELIIEKLTKN